MVTLMSGRAPLTDAERERLGGLLRGLKNPDRLTLEGIDGLFRALIAGPDTVHWRVARSLRRPELAAIDAEDLPERDQ